MSHITVRGEETEDANMPPTDAKPVDAMHLVCDINVRGTCFFAKEKGQHGRKGE